MYKGIIILTYSYAFQNDLKRYGIDHFKEQGLDVYIWDVMKLLYPKDKKTQIYNSISTYENYKLIQNLRELKNELLKLSKEYFIICCFSYDRMSYYIYKIISKCKYDYSIHMANAVPVFSTNQTLIKRVSNKLSNISLKRLFDFIFKIIPFKYLGIRPAKWCLLGGYESQNYKKCQPVDDSSEDFWIHTMDYDEYLRTQKLSDGLIIDYVVFIDEDMPGHTEYELTNIKPYVTEDKYYNSVCKFFDNIEKYFKFEVIIAQHPRADYANRLFIYGKRTILKNRTSELVKNAKFVIAHGSTAINYAIIYRKPLILITTSQLHYSEFGPIIDNYANLLGKRVINIDTSYNYNSILNELEIKENDYKKFINEYIKIDKSENTPFWEVVAKRIAKL